MNPEQIEFERQLAERPHDRAIRGVYADWLEENGNEQAAQRLRWWTRLHAVLENPKKSIAVSSHVPELPHWAQRLVTMHRIQKALDGIKNKRGSLHSLAQNLLASTERDAIGVEPYDHWVDLNNTAKAFTKGWWTRANGSAPPGGAAPAPHLLARAVFAAFHAHGAHWPNQANNQTLKAANDWLTHYHPAGAGFPGVDMAPSRHEEARLHATEDDPTKLARPGSPRVVEDLTQYRQQMRPRLADMHTSGDRRIPFGSDAEHRLIHQFITTRGLKVEKSPYAYYDDASHTLYHPTPEDHVAVAKTYVRQADGAVKLARPPKPGKDPEHAPFTAPIWVQWQAWRKHVADNERRGRPNVYENAPPIMDDISRGVFADWLEEHGNPLAPVVRGHVGPEQYTREGEEQPRILSYRNLGKHPETIHTNKLYHYNTIAQDSPPPSALAEWDFSKDLIHPGRARENRGDSSGASRAVPSVVWRHAGTTSSRRAAGSGRDVEHPVMFHAPVTFDQFFKIADMMPEEKRKQWHAYAKSQGWERPTKLARISGPGAAARASGSDNHAARVMLAKTLLREAGLMPAVAKQVFSHTPEGGLRPAVAAMIGSDASPSVTRFAAAWLGLLLQERSVTVFHPGDGEDTLHVIDSPHPPDHAAEYLKRAGVRSFTLEPKGQGSRAFIVSPMDLDNAKTLATGLQGEHAAIQGTATRLGAPQGDAEARANFRQVIDDSEKEAGYASNTSPVTQGT